MALFIERHIWGLITGFRQVCIQEPPWKAEVAKRLQYINPPFDFTVVVKRAKAGGLDHILLLRFNRDFGKTQKDLYLTRGQRVE